MTDDKIRKRNTTVDRRRFIAGVGTGIAAGLAGCSESTNEPTETTTEDTTTDGTGTTTDGTGTTETTEASVPRGGRPILGISSAPQSLNPLAGGTAYDLAIYEGIYTYGTRLHPETLDVIPWGFAEWELNVDNIGTSEPTIVAQLRDGLTYSDGNAVTAGDVQFTVEYIEEQEPATEISASDFAAVESVGVDNPDGTTVNFFFSEKDNGWATNILGTIFLPPQVWSNVSDYTKYDPLTNGGPVGSGPLVHADFVRDNWHELSVRDADAIPWNGTFDWLRDDGPFIDAVRVEIFGSGTALNQAALDGNIDLTLGTVPVSQAVEATQREELEVIESASRGLRHISYNTRRVPIDDPAFRQFTTKLLDQEFVVDQHYEGGIGGSRGNYFAPLAFEEWRPPDPETIDEYEGITVPDLAFPGERGTNGLDQAAIDEARSFLVEHSRASHDYSFEEATSGNTTAPDGMELYVDGQPFAEGHTDNDGNGGQGPFVISFNPPQEDEAEARIINGWMEALRRVGLPVEQRIETFNSQVSSVYMNENFDCYAMGFSSMSPLVNFLGEELSSAGVDFEGTDQIKFNVMAYTDADDLINEQAAMMSLENRKPVVRRALAKVWADQPRFASVYEKVLQPVNTRFENHVRMAGGVKNIHTWLNVNPVE